MPSAFDAFRPAVDRVTKSVNTPPAAVSCLPAPPLNPLPAKKKARLVTPSTVPLAKVNVFCTSTTATPPVLPFQAGAVMPLAVSDAY